MGSSTIWTYCLSIIRTLYFSLFTLKRDIIGGFCYLQLRLYLWYAAKRNLAVHKIFDGIARKYPEKVCFYFEDQKWTFKKVKDASNQVANYFGSLGYVKGDRVALLMENRPEYVAIWLGLSRIGVVAALINTNLRSNALIHCIKAAKCLGMVYGTELTDAVREVKDDTSLKALKLFQWSSGAETIENKISTATELRTVLTGASVADPVEKQKIGFRDHILFIYTSGTTGLPKAAIIKHSRFISMALVTNIMQRMTSRDILYTPLPLYHSAGGILAIGVALLSGCGVVFRKKFSASQFWKDCIKYEVTVFQYIGELCRFLLAQPPVPEEKKHQIRLIIGNGLRPEIWADFVRRFNIPNVSEIYGSTEGNTNLCNFDNTVGAVGFIPPLFKWFLPIILVKVDKESGEILRDPKSGLAIRCGTNEAGELVGLIRKGSPLSDFDGYTDEKAKSKKIATDICRKGDAAFRSGDILRIDEYGYVYFMDRQGDTFRWRGENVATAEVEQVVSRAVGLKDAAVYGVKVPGQDGRAGMASIVDPENKIDLSTLAAELKKELPAYARPIFIRILKEMPMTGTFKLKKTELQDQGFDLTKITDKVYFLMKGNYVPLTEELFSSIMTSKIKV